MVPWIRLRIQYRFGTPTSQGNCIPNCEVFYLIYSKVQVLIRRFDFWCIDHPRWGQLISWWRHVYWIVCDNASIPQACELLQKVVRIFSDQINFVLHLRWSLKQQEWGSGQGIWHRQCQVRHPSQLWPISMGGILEIHHHLCLLDKMLLFYSRISPKALHLFQSTLLGWETCHICYPTSSLL